MATVESIRSIHIIDDDIELTDMLSSYLQTLGYSVSTSNDSTEGLMTVTSNRQIDLILLDVMMPKMDGFDVLKKLRQTHSTPVLMLTARGDDYDRIIGLELGADDYLPKPFNHRELAARIKAIFRRLELTQSQQHQVDLFVNHIELCPRSQSVKSHGQALDLTGTEFGLLKLLMQRAGELVTKEEISVKILGRKMMAFDRSIDMHVSNIRKKLALTCPQEKIKTVRGSGYILQDVI